MDPVINLMKNDLLFFFHMWMRKQGLGHGIWGQSSVKSRKAVVRIKVVGGMGL